jgi:hypothetical protein
MDAADRHPIRITPDDHPVYADVFQTSFRRVDSKETTHDFS